MFCSLICYETHIQWLYYTVEERLCWQILNYWHDQVLGACPFIGRGRGLLTVIWKWVGPHYPHVYR